MGARLASIKSAIPLEEEVGVLTRVKRNIGEPFSLDVVIILLMHQIIKHKHALNRAKVSFNQENRIQSISFNLEVVGYKLFLDHYKL